MILIRTIYYYRENKYEINKLLFMFCYHLGEAMTGRLLAELSVDMTFTVWPCIYVLGYHFCHFFYIFPIRFMNCSHGCETFLFFIFFSPYFRILQIIFLKNNWKELKSISLFCFFFYFYLLCLTLFFSGWFRSCTPG